MQYYTLTEPKVAFVQDAAAAELQDALNLALCMQARLYALPNWDASGGKSNRRCVYRIR